MLDAVDTILGSQLENAVTRQLSYMPRVEAITIIERVFADGRQWRKDLTIQEVFKAVFFTSQAYLDQSRWREDHNDGTSERS